MRPGRWRRGSTGHNEESNGNLAEPLFAGGFAFFLVELVEEGFRTGDHSAALVQPTSHLQHLPGGQLLNGGFDFGNGAHSRKVSPPLLSGNLPVGGFSPGENGGHQRQHAARNSAVFTVRERDSRTDPFRPLYRIPKSSRPAPWLCLVEKRLRFRSCILENHFSESCPYRKR